MTIRDAYKEYQRLCDQWGDPFLRPSDFLARYIATRLVWLKAKAQEPETEYVIQALGPFRRRAVRTSNIAAGIPLSGLADLFYLRSVLVDFPSGALNKPCTPIEETEFGHVMQNPHKRPDDFFPRCRRIENRLMIYSATVPVRVTIDYVLKPADPVFTPAQASDLPETDLSVGEILQRLMADHDKAVENLTRNQLTAGRDVPARETNN